MPYCRNCGNPIEDESKVCAICGTVQDGSEQRSALAPDAEASKKLNVGMLIWSIINTLMCCMPLGVVSLIMTVLAQNASSAQDEANKLKTAKICNLIGIIGVGVFLILYIILFVGGIIALS